MTTIRTPRAVQRANPQSETCPEPCRRLRNPLTPTQQQILKHLPATSDELAQVLYGRMTRYERRVVYVHIALLRRRLNGTARIVSRRRERCTDADDSTCRIIYELEPPPEQSRRDSRRD